LLEALVEVDQQFIQPFQLAFVERPPGGEEESVGDYFRDITQGTAVFRELPAA
jgi:hypothetical protein